MYVFQCENSVDGIFTAVYDAWASGLGHQNIQISSRQNESLLFFCEYRAVTTDLQKSQKVAQTLVKRLNALFLETVCQCAMADDSHSALPMDKATAIYQTIVMALTLPAGANVLSYLGKPCIFCIFQLCRQTQTESHHLLEFLRFRELKSGVLFAKMHPKNDVLPIVAAHFTNRLPLEDFIIYDMTRQRAAVHKASYPYLITDASFLSVAEDDSLEEDTFQNLWRAFFHSISISDRENKKLQMQHMPKRFWQDMIERPHDAKPPFSSGF